MDVRIGDWLQLARMPYWVKQLPPATQKVFRLALGNAFQVTGFDQHGSVILDFGRALCGKIRGVYGEAMIESRYLRPATPGAGQKTKAKKKRRQPQTRIPLSFEKAVEGLLAVPPEKGKKKSG